jgi:uncharacterized protein YlzI (FlbEa/FlbD family)
LSQKQDIKGYISDYTGRVETVKANNRVYTADNASDFLGVGDKIITHNSSSADIQLLDGRGMVRLDSNTQIEIMKDLPEKQEILISRGKIYGSVEKAEEYIKKIRDSIKDYHEDIKSVGDYFNDEDIENRVNKQLYVSLLNLVNPSASIKYEYDEMSNKIHKHRYIIAVCAVRGTKFTIENKEDGSGEIRVLEGMVDITPEAGKFFKLEEGYIASFKNGIFSDPLKAEGHDSWWEK